MLDTAPALATDSVLLNAIVQATEQALGMCDASAKCVGVSTIPTREPGRVTGLIGVHGHVSGFITLNMAERVATTVVGGLLQDRFDTLTAQIIDGVGEIANIIAGGIKKRLGGSPWAFTDVTVPSVIVGQNYQLAFCRGLEYLAVTFEHHCEDTLMLDDRLIQVAMSLIKL
jgi:chemotaxis protein CheX